MSTCHCPKSIEHVSRRDFWVPNVLDQRIYYTEKGQICFADAMCKLWGFMVEKEPSIGGLITPALSVMNTKGHSLDCQVRCYIILLEIFFVQIGAVFPT